MARCKDCPSEAEIGTRCRRHWFWQRIRNTKLLPKKATPMDHEEAERLATLAVELWTKVYGGASYDYTELLIITDRFLAESDVIDEEWDPDPLTKLTKMLQGVQEHAKKECAAKYQSIGVHVPPHMRSAG